MLIQAHAADTRGGGDAPRAAAPRCLKIGLKKRRRVLLTYKLRLASMYKTWAQERGFGDVSRKTPYGAMCRFVRESSAQPLTTADTQKEIMQLRRA